MRPPTIVVSDVFVNRSLQMVVTKYEPVVETFVSDIAYPTLFLLIGCEASHDCHYYGPDRVFAPFRPLLSILA